MSTVVYLNGRYLPLAEATVPVEDRGFLFGDGIYEVVRAYAGRPFAMTAHLQRLRRSAGAIRLQLPATDLATVATELLARNDLSRSNATIYIQVTRGHPGPRVHAFPTTVVPPTVLVIARPLPALDPELWSQGVTAITCPDQRWGRCDIKAIGLLPNVLAKQQAVDAGVHEALLVRDGLVVEGATSNLFAVSGGEIHTHPADQRILAGVTRQAVIDQACRAGIPVHEQPISASELQAADEVFITSTISEVLGVVRIDGQTIGNGRPGPLTRNLHAALMALIHGGA